MGKRPQLLKDVVLRYLREEGLETPLNQHRLMASWQAVVGETIAKRTGKMYIRQGVLHVNITSAPLKASLYLNRKVLAERLNKEAGSHVINDIIFK